MITLIIWTGTALIVLGVAGGIATTALTAFIPAVIGLILLVLGALARNPERTGLMQTLGLGVAGLGALAALANLGRLFGAGGLGLNAATFSNLAMAGICATLVAAWAFKQVTGTPLIEDR